MKGLLLLAAAGFTWYLAGMYHLFSLMALAVTELLILAAMFVVSRFLGRRFRARFSREFLVAEKGREAECPVETEYTGRFPPGRCRLRVECRYWQEEPQLRKVPVGKAEERLSLQAAWCGMLHLRLLRGTVTDPLDLFRSRIRTGGELRIAVLPPPRAVRVEAAGSFPERPGAEEILLPAQKNGEGEFRQIREYAPGDPSRRIHWKQSARNDRLLVRECQPEEEKTVLLHLDLQSGEHVTARRLDAFMEILSAVLNGLIEGQASVQLVWKKGRKEAYSQRADNREAVQEILLWLCGREEDIKEISGAPALCGQGLWLGLDLRLTLNGKELFAFSEEGYAEELERLVLYL